MRSIVITGAGGGLGSEVVLRLEREYRVLAPSRETLDVTSERSVAGFFAAESDLYALVHLVGGWSGGNVAETSVDQWRQMFELNATAAFLTMREAARSISRPGRIVAISSIATQPVKSGSAAYTVSKSALNALVQSLAADLRGSGVTVNAIAPDTMATPANLAGGADASKFVKPADVAETIAFLLSAAASSISGAVVSMRA
jgi:NAD(P)-dependent dehydrogenase (short-subunit alcohol dehydrogenase family)